MSRRDASLLLQDMREAMQKIARYTAGMDVTAFLADTIHAKDFTRQVKTGDLFLAFLGERVRLDGTAAYGKDGLEGIAGAEHVLAFAERARALDDVV